MYVPTKRCSKCNYDIPVSHFHDNFSFCKSCGWKFSTMEDALTSAGIFVKDDFPKVTISLRIPGCTCEDCKRIK